VSDLFFASIIIYADLFITMTFSLIYPQVQPDDPSNPPFDSAAEYIQHIDPEVSVAIEPVRPLDSVGSAVTTLSDSSVHYSPLSTSQSPPIATCKLPKPTRQPNYSAQMYILPKV
jgi:hypothetical protein